MRTVQQYVTAWTKSIGKKWLGHLKLFDLGRGCGAVGRVVASNTRDLFICKLLSRKDEKKRKRGREWPIKKPSLTMLLLRLCQASTNYVLLANSLCTDTK